MKRVILKIKRRPRNESYLANQILDQVIDLSNEEVKEMLSNLKEEFKSYGGCK